MATFNYDGFEYLLTSFTEFVNEYNIKNNQLANAENVNKSVNQLKREVNQLIGQVKILTAKEAIRWRADVIYEPGEIVSYILTDAPSQEQIENSYYIAIPNTEVNQAKYPETSQTFWKKITLGELYPWLEYKNYPTKTDNTEDWEITDEFDVVNLKKLQAEIAEFKRYIEQEYLPSYYLKIDNNIPLTPENDNDIVTKKYVDEVIADVLGSTGELTEYVFLDKKTGQMKTKEEKRTSFLTPDYGIMPGKHLVSQLGDSVNSFKVVYSQEYQGSAMKAKLADLAEVYKTNKKFKPGTILGINSDGISEFSDFLHQRPLGVVSDKPGFILNKDEKGVLIALKGQTPILVKGCVNVGDELYAHGAYATTEVREAKYYVGLALERSDSDDIKLINSKV